MKGQGAAWVAVIGLCALPACELGDAEQNGGGGFGSEQTVTLAGTDTLDGWVRSPDGNSASLGGTWVIVGDIFSGGVTYTYRGFYSFDISAIPAGSSVASATLRLHQISVIGSPYSELGNVVVDHVDYGAALSGLEDFSVPALASGVGTLSTDATLGLRTLSVTARVQADVTAGRARSQFRLRFSPTEASDDGNSDFAQFADAGYVIAAEVPQLEVRYRAPVTP
jgi:hypothetical protein